MKSIHKIIFAAMLVVAFLAFLAPPSAEAQLNNGTQISITNLPKAIVGGATSNLTGNVITLRQGAGMSVVFGGIGTNTFTTNNVTVTWNVSRDGSTTNLANNGPIVTTAPLNGTNQIYYWTNYSPTVLNNNPCIVPTSITVAGTNQITNITMTVLFGNPYTGY